MLFSSGSVYCTYLVGRKLGGDDEVSLLAAFFMAILPLSVYFGRNIQPDAAALLFLLLFTYFYLRWIENFKARYLLLFALFVFITAIVKGTFLFMVIPLLFLFPYVIFRLLLLDWKNLYQEIDLIDH